VQFFLFVVVLFLVCFGNIIGQSSWASLQQIVLGDCAASSILIEVQWV
jgi:hypothetical protein